MGRRRAPYKMKVQLPADDPDSESDTESEKKAGDSDSTNFEEGNSLDGEQSGTKEEDEEEEDDSVEATSSVETKPRVKKKGGDAGSSDDSDLEETVRSRLWRLTKKANLTAEASSSDESSESEDETSREGNNKLKTKRERRESSSKGQAGEAEKSDSSSEEPAGEAEKSDSSSEDSSDTEDEATQKTQKTPTKLDGKASGAAEESEDDEETEDERQFGSDTDSEEEYQPQEEADADEEEDAQSEDLDDLAEESELESDDEWEKRAFRNEAEPSDKEDEVLCTPNDRTQAKRLLRNILARVPLVEETAIRRGVQLSGPPLEYATTHSDEYARKFRWPQHVRNLRKTDFSQDPQEILEDYEIVPGAQQSGSNQEEQDAPQESAFAQVPRPIVALAAEALRRSSRKRKRSGGDGDENQAEPGEEGPSAASLLSIARIGGQFGDHFVESLLTANARALQGIDDGFDYDKRCWSSLPTRKKPIANWRFVLEHVRRTMCKSDGVRDVIYPPMKPETLERITKRLKKLYGCTTQHEEYDVFEPAKPSSSENDAESKA